MNYALKKGVFMKIYSARHGQTDFNKENKILGTTDIPLNDTGISQAEIFAENVRHLGDVDIIISSPMIRAKTTAEFAAEKCGLKIITDERLREWNYGEYEGKPRSETFAADKELFAVRMGKTGESLLQLAHRVYSFLDDIIKNYSDKNILVVSHGGVCRMIETYFNDMTTAEYSNWFMGNCQIIEYDI